MRCPACARDIPNSSRFCPECGAALDLGSTPTVLENDSHPSSGPPSPAPRTPAPKSGLAGRRDSSDPTSSSSWSGTGRFITGTILVGRYRIVSALGRGGMGEVYRAEDITLQQEIALKFLPAELTNDPAALERFHREVRIARQVSHPNVCRVFDIGVSDGASFITMEYVDGEDLSSLIRRIGRFPQDKGLEIARQICAGLAAAHEQGLLHRDLKPANVMLDGRGRVRVTDFGLATLAAEAHGADVRSGTPAYMAPEQLAGTGVTLKSDIYALGLVLYEIFTGKRAFDAPTVAELNRVRESSVPASPTTLVKELDPLIERVIQRCLEKDPERRPASALQVAAALPGGNPLAAALAAGELPSPEMVAAAGNKEGIRPRYVWASIGVVAICILIEFLLSGQTRIYRTVGFPKPPEVLADRAQDILRGMGYTATPGDTATGFDVDGDYLNYVEKHDTSATRWNHVTGAVQFWYRESRTDMLATQILSGSVQGRVTEGDPRVDEPGMKIMHLDPQGRLEYLRVAPLRKVSTKTASPPETDWNRLLTEAGFDPANCTRADSEWIPYSYADARAAWTASMPERPDVTLHVEAASFQGKPVYFSIFAPWTPSGAAGLTGANRVQAISAVLIVGLMLVGGIILAWKNLKLKRADLKGSLRLAGFVFCLTLATWAIGASHVASLIEAYSLTLALSWASLAAIFLWMMYVALEPFVRRRMPTLVISWNRLLAGQFRDPMVGRDLLVGISTALFFVSLSNLDIPYAAMRRLPPPMPSTNLVAISGGRLIFSMLLSTVNSAILDALAFLFLVVILQWVLRNRWLAVAGFVAIFTVRAYLQGGPAFDIALNAIALAAIGFLMFRFGLVAVVAFQFTDNIISGAPITTQGSAWYAWMGWLGVAVIAAIVIYAARIGLAGQPLFGRALTADD